MCVDVCVCVITVSGRGARSSLLTMNVSSDGLTSTSSDAHSDSHSHSLEGSVYMPVLSLCNLLLSLWQSLLAHRHSEIVTILSEHCFSAVLLVGRCFLPSTLMVTRHLLLISRFAAQQECLQRIVTPATVSHLIGLISFHIEEISLISSALVLFSDFSAIEV